MAQLPPWLPQPGPVMWWALAAIAATFVAIRVLRRFEDPERIGGFFRRTMLAAPLPVVLVVFAGVAALATQLPNFNLEASSESLILESDPDLVAYNRTRMVFGSDEYVIVSFTRDDLFTPGALQFVHRLAGEFAKQPGVDHVLAITNTPLYRMTGAAAMAMGRPALTVMSPGVDLAKARDELTSSPVWGGNLISADGRTTNVIVYFAVPRENIEAERELLGFRDRIAADRAAGRPAAALVAEHAAKKAAFRSMEDRRKQQRRETVAHLRRVMGEFRAEAEFYASGVPIVVIDMVEFIRRDMVMFGFGVVVFLVVALSLLFRAWRWVLFPLLVCAATVVTVMGAMAWMDRRVTVVTSNSTSVLFIIAMAHSIHFAIRYRENIAVHPGRGFRDQLAGVCGDLWTPCFYTAITTVAGFAATGITDIRPVIEFAVFMSAGTMLALVLSFLLLPSGLALLPVPPDRPQREGRLHFMRRVARFTVRGRFVLPLLGLALAVAGVLGMRRLEVETRFIDYFDRNTEIARGLVFIDTKMGGTTSLEVILDGGQKDWFTRKENLDKLAMVAAHLKQVPEVGKVLSVHDLVLEGLRAFEGGRPPAGGAEGEAAAGLAARLAAAFGSVGLQAVAWEGVPARARAAAEDRRLGPVVALLRQKLDPATLSGYVSADWSQARVFVRMRESAPTLQRRRLITELQDWLRSRPELASAKPQVTGIFLLYTNMLDSLMASQVGTFWIAFVAIFFMLWALFRSFRLALMGMVPNILPILMVLGAMGWAGVHLDMMTIMIASISLGIAVDATIHYTFRFDQEFRRTGGYLRTLFRSHVTIGRAIFYTTMSVLVGFWVLMLSNFKPTLYFGLFTGVAMLGALFGALTLLPIMLLAFRPLKRSAPPGGLPGRGTGR